MIILQRKYAINLKKAIFAYLILYFTQLWFGHKPSSISQYQVKFMEINGDKGRMYCHHTSRRGEPMCSPYIDKRVHLGRHIGLPLRVGLSAFISSRAKRYLPFTPSIFRKLSLRNLIYNPNFAEISNMRWIGFTAFSAMASSTSTAGHSYFSVL